MGRPVFILWRVGLFAFAGVVTTVAVSWGLALWGTNRCERDIYTIDWTDPSGMLSCRVDELRALGINRRIRGMPGQRRGGFAASRFWKVTETRYLEHRHSDPIWPGTDVSAEDRRGWPFRAMWCGWTWRLGQDALGGPMLTISVSDGALVGGRPVLAPVGPAPAFNIADPRVVPMRPLWGGAMANTAIYGLAWALAFWGFNRGRAWWRASRGRCRSCGYDRSGVGVGMCPECGSDPARGS